MHKTHSAKRQTDRPILSYIVLSPTAVQPSNCSANRPTIWDNRCTIEKLLINLSQSLLMKKFSVPFILCVRTSIVVSFSHVFFLFDSTVGRETPHIEGGWLIVRMHDENEE